MISQFPQVPDVAGIIIILAKVSDFFISVVLAIKIKKMSNYVLNTLFFIALIGWASYIGTDAILYEIAPIILVFFNIANLLRHVGMIGISLVPLCYILAAFLIKDGEEITFQQKKKRIILAFVVNFTILMGVIVNDSIVVYVNGTKIPIDPTTLPPTVAYSVNFDSVTLKGEIAYIFYMSYCIWYFIAIYLMFSIQKRESGLEKRRARYIMYGMLMIPVGILYYVLLGPNVPPDVYEMLDILGHIIWTLSPVLIYLGLRIQSNNAPNTIKSIKES